MNIQQTDTAAHNAFRGVLQLLLNSSLLLSFEEKEEFSALLPMLNMSELSELFNLLVGAKRDTENILKKLVNDFPDVVKQLDKFQVGVLKDLYKGQRKVLKEGVVMPPMMLSQAHVVMPDNQ